MNKGLLWDKSKTLNRERPQVLAHERKTFLSWKTGHRNKYVSSWHFFVSYSSRIKLKLSHMPIGCPGVKHTNVEGIISYVHFHLLPFQDTKAAHSSCWEIIW